jgi:guanine nucleotide-binding protein alpha-1 subunit
MLLIDSHQAFRAELPSWRAVIQLNVIRSIRLILETLTEAQSSSSGIEYPPLSTQHLKLKMKVSPLLQIEEALTRRLTSDATIRIHGETVDSALAPITDIPARREVTVNSWYPWKSYFSRPQKSRKSDEDDEHGIDWNDPKDPGRVLHACREDMIQLWNDPVVREILNLAKVRVEELSGL